MGFTKHRYGWVSGEMEVDEGDRRRSDRDEDRGKGDGKRSHFIDVSIDHINKV